MKPGKLIWEEKDIYEPTKFGVAHQVYHDMDERHRAAFKNYRADYILEMNEKELFPEYSMWGFPSTRVSLFKFSISPRYNKGEHKFLELEYPFMSVHSFLGKFHNNHIYLKSVDEGKEYAQKLFDEVFKQLIIKLGSVPQKLA